jgi:hypothetical protein
MTEQSKEKCHTVWKESKKMKMLKVLPNSWLIRKIQHEFKPSNYMVWTPMKLVT